MTGDLLDQHFRAREVRFNADHIGKWYAASREGGYLCSDGTVRLSALGSGLLCDALFDDYADLEAAYKKWLKRRENAG